MCTAEGLGTASGIGATAGGSAGGCGPATMWATTSLTPQTGAAGDASAFHIGELSESAETRGFRFFFMTQ